MAGLRDSRGWSQSDAARFARQRGLAPPLSRNVLLRLESGETKFPEADVLRAVASLYEHDYQDVVNRCVVERYSVGLNSPVTGRISGSGSLKGGSADVPASRDRKRHSVSDPTVTKLSAKLARYETRLSQVRARAREIANIASGRGEGRKAARGRA